MHHVCLLCLFSTLNHRVGTLHISISIILELRMELTRDRKEIVLIWGNSAADSAVKDALNGSVPDELIPFSGLKSCVNKYVLELWQSEWDEFSEDTLH